MCTIVDIVRMHKRSHIHKANREYIRTAYKDRRTAVREIRGRLKCLSAHPLMERSSSSISSMETVPSDFRRLSVTERRRDHLTHGSADILFVYMPRLYILKINAPDCVWIALACHIEGISSVLSNPIILNSTRRVVISRKLMENVDL